MEEYERRTRTEKIDPKKRKKKMKQLHQTKRSYKRVLEKARQEWSITTDGVVTELRFYEQKQKFVATYSYQEKNYF